MKKNKKKSNTPNPYTVRLTTADLGRVDALKAKIPAFKKGTLVKQVFRLGLIRAEEDPARVFELDSETGRPTVSA